MLDAATFGALCSSQPALAALPDKVAELLRGELNPGEEVAGSYSVQISGSAGALVVTPQRVIAVWITKMLLVLKFPTVQEFNLGQLNEVVVEGTSVRMHASATPGDREDDYEENTFLFGDGGAAQGFAQLVGARAPRLTG